MYQLVIYEGHSTREGSTSYSLLLEICMQVKQCGICLLLREKERVSGHGVAKTQRAQALTAAEAGDWARRA